ncbi:MAG: tetratricopeptide repeat protein [Cytophagaceae bacterium]|jgi:tetratricopeptide (TPR) repeat protein|nr:tetratricopeptide repeat protein [Cytophagaceae bacterium]
MRDQLPAKYNEDIEDVKRFEQMEDGQTECYFDVHSIENIFDFYAENEQFDKAERVLRLGIKIHPGSTTLMIRQAIVMAENGDDERAILLLNTLAKLEQSEPEIHFNLGWSYMKIGKVPEAVACFKRTLDMAFDEYDDFLLDIALFLNQSEEYNLAINFLEPGCKKYPNNENLLFELAYAYDKVDEIEKGIDIYNCLLDVNPFSENGWYNLGILFIKNDDYTAAINCYDYALAINPKHSEALFNKANTLVCLGELKEALNYYIEYISYGYDITVASHYIGDCLEQMEEYTLALRFYRLAVKTDPQYIPAWLGYLALLINQEYTKEALIASAKALTISNAFPEFMYLRGRAQLLAGNYDSALKWFDAAMHNDLDSLRNLYEWLQLKQNLDPAENISDHLGKWMIACPDSAAVNYAAAAFTLRETGNMNAVARYLAAAMRIAPADIYLFLDLFDIPENDIFENKILSPIVDKYKDYGF